MAIDAVMAAALVRYQEQLEANYDRVAKSDYVDIDNRRDKYYITFVPGKKYIKVVMNHIGQPSAHSFIVNEIGGKFEYGTILKAASWKVPAKNFSRGNVLKNEYGRAATRWVGM